MESAIKLEPKSETKRGVEYGLEIETKFVNQVKLQLESLEVEGVKLDINKFNHSLEQLTKKLFRFLKKYEVNPEEFNTQDLLIMGLSLMDSWMSFTDNQQSKKAELAKAREELNQSPKLSLTSRLKNLTKSDHDRRVDAQGEARVKEYKLAGIKLVEEELSAKFVEHFKQILARFKYLCIITEKTSDGGENYRQLSQKVIHAKSLNGQQPNDRTNLFNPEVEMKRTNLNNLQNVVDNLTYLPEEANLGLMLDLEQQIPSVAKMLVERGYDLPHTPEDIESLPFRIILVDHIPKGSGGFCETRVGEKPRLIIPKAILNDFNNTLKHRMQKAATHEATHGLNLDFSTGYHNFRKKALVEASTENNVANYGYIPEGYHDQRKILNKIVYHDPNIAQLLEKSVQDEKFILPLQIAVFNKIGAQGLLDIEFVFSDEKELQTPMGKLIAIKPETVFDRLCETLEEDLTGYLGYLKDRYENANFDNLVLNKNELANLYKRQKIERNPSDYLLAGSALDFSGSLPEIPRGIDFIPSYRDDQTNTMMNIRLQLGYIMSKIKKYDLRVLLSPDELKTFKSDLYDLDKFAFRNQDSNKELENLFQRIAKINGYMDNNLKSHAKNNTFQTKAVRFMTKDIKLPISLSNIVDFFRPKVSANNRP